jgi:hypothetical protein
MEEDTPRYLKQNEHFHRTRRNFMLAAATLFVLALAAPPTIKIPGLGEEAVLPSALAYAALWPTMALLGYEYFVEHSYVRALNAEAASGQEDAAIQNRFLNRLMLLDELSKKFVDLSRDLEVARISKDSLMSVDQESLDAVKSALNESVATAQHIAGSQTHPGATVEHLSSVFESAREAFGRHVDELAVRHLNEWESQRSRIDRQLADTNTVLSAIKDDFIGAVQNDAEAVRLLAARYDRLSKAVHATQRTAFAWKDTWVPICVGLAATLAMVVPLSGLRWPWSTGVTIVGSNSLAEGGPSNSVVPPTGVSERDRRR